MVLQQSNIEDTLKDVSSFRRMESCPSPDIKGEVLNFNDSHQSLYFAVTTCTDSFRYLTVQLTAAGFALCKGSDFQRKLMLAIDCMVRKTAEDKCFALANHLTLFTLGGRQVCVDSQASLLQ